MIVINVDIPGNGRTGAFSKCTEAGNEPHQFLRCKLFHRAAAETGTAGPGFVRQPLPTASSWGGTCSSCAMGWTCPAGNGPSSASVLAKPWVTVRSSAIQSEGTFTR